MLEKYYNIDFINSTNGDINNILSEILQLTDDNIKEILKNIIEKYDINMTLNSNYELFFSNEKIYPLLDEIYNECDIKL